MRKLAFVGAGKVGTALSIALQGAGYPVVAIGSRSFSSALNAADQVPGAVAFRSPTEAAAAGDLVFLTVPDDAIRTVACSLPWRAGQTAVHCSGSLSLDVLEAATAKGATAGGLHPLQSFASVENAVQNLPGSAFGIEAVDEAVAEELSAMARAMKGVPIRLGPGAKTLYHASAVIACNYLVTLVSLATGLWEEFGADRQQAIHALMPLLRGTLSNLEMVGLPNALTGPIARGDAGTLAKHLAVLEAVAPEIATLYRSLGRHTIPIGLSKGSLSPEAAEVVRKLLAG